jgi:hypothetical protein
MRAKALILTAALSIAGLTTSVAQVYSVNAVGYVSVDFPTGFSLFTNPLDAGDGNNTVGNLLGDPPLFSNYYNWNGASFDIATYLGGGEWDPAAASGWDLSPGGGGFINLAEAYSVTFVGEVIQSVNDAPIDVAIAQGFSIISSKVPQAGGVTSVLELTQLGLFDNLYQWDNASGGYTIFTYLGDSTWDPSEPSIAVGEAFFVNAAAAATWSRVFTVN